MEGEIHLPMPHIPALLEEREDELEFVQPELIAQCEEAIMMWQTHIDSTISACLNKVERTSVNIVSEFNKDKGHN